MRAFKHIPPKDEAELAKIFPNYRDFAWQDDGSMIQLPISIWDKWVNDITEDVDAMLWECSDEESLERELKFCNLAVEIVTQFDVYGYFHNQDKLKKVRSKEQLISDIVKSKELERALFIPCQEAIYFQSHDYTAWLYLSNQDKGKVLKGLVEQCGLKFIK